MRPLDAFAVEAPDEERVVPTLPLLMVPDLACRESWMVDKHGSADTDLNWHSVGFDLVCLRAPVVTWRDMAMSILFVIGESSVEHFR